MLNGGHWDCYENLNQRDYDSSLRRALLQVLKTRSRGGNNYRSEAKDLDTKQEKNLGFNISGLLEATDHAFKAMKSPKDIFSLDLDNNGKWKVVNEDQLEKL